MEPIDYLAIAIQVIWGISEYFVAVTMRSDKKDSRSNDYKIVYLIQYVCIGLGIFVGIEIRIYNLWNLYWATNILIILGICLMILGMIVRYSAIFTLKKAFTINLAITENQKLIKSGLYKYIRHPAYFGGILAFVGFGICYRNIVSILLISIPYICFIFSRIRKEEPVLVGKFGEEYRELQRTTKKLIPFIY
jgi:protein-S-isoprenylcysteine O-methyltransferase Ste14